MPNVPLALMSGPLIPDIRLGLSESVAVKLLNIPISIESTRAYVCSHSNRSMKGAMCLKGMWIGTRIYDLCYRSEVLVLIPVDTQELEGGRVSQLKSHDSHEKGFPNAIREG
jgi:hypothetical protein